MIPVVKGTRDILPDEALRWQYVESALRRLLELYGYKEVRTPLIEREQLFAKGTGESTDIVQKEMYNFTDKSGERVTLRPEATPSMVRAFVEHNLGQVMLVPKLYSFGPMFRYERPQKGRYRQFHQLDVEVFGVSDPAIDAEILEMAWTLVCELVPSRAELVVNSVGCKSCRPMFSSALLESLGDRVSELCGDCQRRSKINPLRIFDCKVPRDQPIIDALPHSIDYLCKDCRVHFDAVLSQISDYDIPHRLSHRLVRGLDYYTRTTFEVLIEGMGAQNAVLGGGRYDGLVRHLGGPDCPGIGFAVGLERLVNTLAERVAISNPPAVFLVAIGDDARLVMLTLIRELRQAGFSTQMDYDARSLKTQMKRADRSGAPCVLILGSDELARNEITVREMRTGNQRSISKTALLEYLGEALPEWTGKSESNGLVQE